VADKSLRTMTFVPGYMRKFLEKAGQFASDALILDVEDSVPDPFKGDARRYIRQCLDEDMFPQQVFIRVNSIDSGLLLEDLHAMMHRNVEGFMFSKARDERDIVYYDKLLSQLERQYGFEQGRFRMCPLIETGSAILRAYQMATASPRMRALAFGGEDYLTDLDGLHLEHGTSLIVPRSLIVIAARAARIEAIDTPYLAIRDLEGFRREVSQARELGFSGQLVLHPSQIAVANEIFTPSAEEVAESQRILAAIAESGAGGLGVTLLDGRLIGPPMLARARHIESKLARIRHTEATCHPRADGRAQGKE
jgi:citrate lyase subunit beta/citryl-CoA lyase